MALITCPDCDRQISDAAAACIGCGRPMQAVAAPAPAPTTFRTEPAPPRETRVPAPPALIGADGRRPLACPRCEGLDVAKLSIIFHNGLARVDSHTTGVGVGGGGIGVGSARTSGVSQTVASQSAAPPQQKPIGGVLAGAVILGFMGLVTLANGSAGGLLFLGIAGICGYVFWKRFEWNRDVFPRLMQQWENTYRCGRCGTEFQWPTQVMVESARKQAAGAA